MHKFLISAAVLALLASPAAGQQTATSGSNSDAVSGSISGAVNGAIDASSRTNSNSNSGATANTSSYSTAEGGNANSTSNAVTGASTSSATTGQSTATNTANPTATNAGNAQAITFNTVNPDKLRTVPQVYAPALTTTLTETCMGSTSGGASWLGGGFSLGSSWRDDECVRRLNARELSQTLGDREAARAILCGNPAILAAYDRLGRPCPQSPYYKPELAGLYMPQPVVQVASLPPPPPPAPTPEPPQPTAVASMAPIPNPPEPAKPAARVWADPSKTDAWKK